jgi:formylglycine-generating enzyme required for sulfatase activity
MPTIERFDASSSQVEIGTAVNLTARFSNGAGVVHPQAEAVRSGGPVTVAPSETTTYTLIVTDPEGRKISQQTTVTVKPGLAITIWGHEGLAGKVKVEGPNGFTRTLDASGFLTGLEAGEYTVTAIPVDTGQAMRHPWQPCQRVRVITGKAVTVLYPAPTLSLPLPGGTPLDFVLIPAGAFTMGEDHPAVPQRFPNPSPAHLVTLQQAFYMAKVPTTQAQWEAILGCNPSELKNPNYPLTNASYYDIKSSFLPAINERIPELNFRLPSEAEWEYACRAGTTTTYFHGDDPAQILEYAWPSHAFQSQDHTIGRKRPNPWGIYDLAGLVFQWCEDLAHDGYLGAPIDGSPRTDALAGHEEEGILRGYSHVGRNLPGGNPEGGSAIRWSWLRSGQRWDLGFRLLAAPNVNHAANATILATIRSNK